MSLKVISLASLSTFKAVHHHTNGVYNYTELNFGFQSGNEILTVKGREQAEEILEQIDIRRQQAAEAMGRHEDMSIHDAFTEARENDWEPQDVLQSRRVTQQPMARSLPLVLSRAFITALGAAAVISAPAWFVRNNMSDQVMYRTLTQHSDEHTIESYIAAGGKYAAEARETLLPAAALREAKRKGTVTAYRKVTNQYPDTSQADEARKQIGALFQATLKEFRSQANTGNASMTRFMDRLFVYLEANNSPPIEVRFGPPTAADVRDADALLKKMAGAKAVPIANHFSATRSQAREATIVQYLQDAFSQIFPADILSLKNGELANRDVPVTTPTIEILYHIAPSGNVYVEETTKRKFVGIQIGFDVQMRLPEDDAAFQFAVTVAPPKRFTVNASPLDRYSAKHKESDGGAVYNVMVVRAFGELADTLRRTFFRPGTDAFHGIQQEQRTRGYGSRFGQPDTGIQ